MYQVHKVQGVIELETGEWIKPLVNPKWQEYKAWLKAGNVPLPADLDTIPIITAAKKKSAELQDWLTTSHNAPIMYKDVVFDADQNARENITGVLARLMRGAGKPDQWMGWRTYDNDMVWIAISDQDLLAELGGLSTAIEDRKQALMIAAWTKKSELLALLQSNNLDGIQNLRIG